MKDPAFLFYSSDFLSGVQDLTLEERGQYITLLCLQHLKGHLTEKIIKLTIGNATADVMAKFRLDQNNCYFSPRLDQEIQNRLEFKSKQRERAINGWKTRKSKNNDNATANAMALPVENEDENENLKSRKGVTHKKNNTFSPPTIDEVKTYFREKGYKPDIAQRAFDYYTAADWCDSQGNKVKNWKQKMIANWFRPEHAITADNEPQPRKKEVWA